MVRNAYQGIGGEYETLLKAFDRENEVFKKRVGKDRKLATYQSRVVARNYVAAFIKSFYKRSDMSMLELTPDFIKEFAVYLATEAGLRVLQILSVDSPHKSVSQISSCSGTLFKIIV